MLEVEHVDPTALYEWALPRAEQLGAEFSCSGWPRADLDIWLRKRYLATPNEQPSPALDTPSTAARVVPEYAEEPATGSAFRNFMFQLARRVLL
jgi:hypothetical protein